MTYVKTTCPECGSVTLPLGRFRVVATQDHKHGFYRFTCTCGLLCTVAAPPDVIMLLRGGGLVVEYVPAELLEAHPGGPMSADEVLDFLGELESLDDVADLS